MPIIGSSHDVLVDWDRNGWAAIDALPTDAPNQFSSLEIDNISFYHHEVISGAASFTFADELSNHGTKTIVCTGSTFDNDAGVKLWKNGSTYDLFAASGQTYRVSFWWKTEAGDGWLAGETLRFQMRVANDGSTHQNIDVVPFTVGTGIWTKVSFNAYTPGSNSNIIIRAFKQSVVGTRTWRITGYMYTQNATMPMGFNIGINSLNENVSWKTKSFNFKFGMEPFSKIGDDIEGEIVLNNSGRYFSTGTGFIDNMSYYGFALNQKVWIVRGGTYDDIRIRAYIREYEVDPFLTGAQEVRIGLGGIKSLIEDKPVDLAYYTNTTATTILGDILNSVGTFDTDFDTALYTIPSFGDTAIEEDTPKKKDKLAKKKKQDLPTLYDLIEDLMTLEYGHFWEKRNGVLAFRNSTWKAGADSYYDATVDHLAENDFDDIEFTIGAECIINKTEVMVYPKEIGGSAIVLWSLPSTMIIPVNTTFELRCKYRDSNNIGVGGSSVVTPTGADLVSSGGTLVVTFSAKASHANVTLQNTSGSSEVTLSTFNIRGVPVYTRQSYRMSYKHPQSVSTFGVKEQNIDNKAMIEPDRAYSLAVIETQHRILQIEGAFDKLTYISRDDGTTDDDLCLLDIGDTIQVAEYQTAVGGAIYGSVYKIMNIQESVDAATLEHKFVFGLEILLQHQGTLTNYWFVLDDNLLGLSNSQLMI